MEAVEKEINSKVSSNMDKTQKEYFLREKLKVIKSELGDSGDISDISDLKESKEGIRRIFDLFIDDPNADTITLSSWKKIK